MFDQLLFLLTSIVLAFLLYPIWISFVYRYHMGESIRSDGPKAHLAKVGTPTMGGFVFLVVACAITFLFNRSRTQTLFPIFVASIAGLLGLLEDLLKVYKTSSLSQLLNMRRLPELFALPFNFLFRIPLIGVIWQFFKDGAQVLGSSGNRGLQTYQKFLVQFSLGFFVAYWTYFKLGWDYIWFPLIGDVHIGILYPVFVFFLFLAVMNFVAFTDGVDGLAGGLALIAFVSYWVVASFLQYNSLATLAATFVGALLPFLYFNVYPARIFMGDVGSHVLGATLVLFSIVMHREVALFFILALFLLDGLSSPFQQLSVKFTKKRVFRMAPMHHHFELMGWPEAKVTFRFWIVGALFAAFGIFVALM